MIITKIIQLFTFISLLIPTLIARIHLILIGDILNNPLRNNADQLNNALDHIKYVYDYHSYILHDHRCNNADH